MTLPNCKCGDAPEGSFKHGIHDENTWEIRCRECEIYIYAPTQEQAETIWTDAQEAAELREKVKRMYKQGAAIPRSASKEAAK